MDYEKKYKEALEWARKVIQGKVGFVLDEVLEKFPELKESEDEKIRKEILNYIIKGSESLYDVQQYGKERFEKWIAWLEKQGEHANFCSKIQIGDKVTRNEDGVLVNLSQLKRVAKPAEEYNITGIGSKNAQGKLGEMIKNLEQKPAWSEDGEPQKELAETYLAVFDKKFPILPTLKGKQLADYKNFLNKCQQILGLKYWGLRPLQAKLFEKLSLLWAAWGAEHLKGLGQTDGDTDNEKQE